MFKNVRFFQIDPRQIPAAEILDQSLRNNEFTPAKAALFKSGWTRPMDESKLFVHTTDVAMTMCLRTDRKLITGKALSQLVEKRVRKIEQTTGNKVTKKQRSDLSLEVIAEIAPKLLEETSYTYGFIHRRTGLVAIEASTQKAAEDFLDHLRGALGTLPTQLIATQKLPSVVMSNWLLENDAPEGLMLGGNCELLDKTEEAGRIKFTRQVLTDPDVTKHLMIGTTEVDSIEVQYENKCSFTLKDDKGVFALKGIKFDDLLIGEETSDSESKAQRFDSEIHIYTGLINEVAQYLVGVFGGHKVEETIREAA